MSMDSDALLGYLSEISDKSNLGEIFWSQPNTSVFRWVRDVGDDEYIVTIQKASNPKRRSIGTSTATSLLLKSMVEKYVYMFLVQSKKNKQTAISISSSERPEFAEVLANIFEGASKGMDVHSSNVLKKLLQKD